MAREDVFSAIADPTRRSILDHLRDRGPLRAGELAASFPEMSRPAVSRHLRVLRESGLVADFERGRERWYSLEAEPLHRLYVGWLSEYSHYWSHRMADLKSIAEEEAEGSGGKADEEAD